MAARPRRVLFLLVAVACAGACKKKEELPAASPLFVEGASCVDYGCIQGLVCTRTSKRCTKPDDPEVLKDLAAERDRERAFLEESGVAVAPTPAEAPVPVPAPPEATSPTGAAAATSGAVRIVRVDNKNAGAWAIAACRADERLVSGGCRMTDPNRVMTVDSYPISESSTDTIGGRWSCGKREATYDLPLEAFALCQRL